MANRGLPRAPATATEIEASLERTTGSSHEFQEGGGCWGARRERQRWRQAEWQGRRRWDAGCWKETGEGAREG
jgi:hypothetical protein